MNMNNWNTDERSQMEARIQAAIALRDFDSVVKIADPFLNEFMVSIPKELAMVLAHLSQQYGRQFPATQIFTAFLRGWRQGEPGRKLENTEYEMKSEIDLLTSKNSTDLFLTYANRINDYFYDAVWLYAKTDDPAAKLAAQSAAAVAQDEQRESLIGYLRALADDWAQRSPNIPMVNQRLERLADDISSGDWNLEDTVDFKRKLAEVDPEYFYALAGSDPTVFRDRFEEIFRDYDMWYPK